MSAWWISIIVVALAIAAAVGGMLIVRRVVGLPFLKRHNEVAGSIYSVLGVLYGALLAFTVVTAWERRAQADEYVSAEANSLADLYRDAEAFPGPVRDSIRSHILEYARIVIEEEWPAMARGEESDAAWGALHRIWAGYLGFEPAEGYQRAWYDESIDRLNDLDDYRRLRLLRARAPIPGLLWTVLLVLAVVTTAFSFLFGARDVRAQAIMTAALAGVLVLSLFIIRALEKPFAPPAGIEPDAFSEVFRPFDRWAGE